MNVEQRDTLGRQEPRTGSAQNGQPTYPPRIPELLSETVDNRMRFESEAGFCDDRRGIRNEWEQDTGQAGPLRSDE